MDVLVVEDDGVLGKSLERGLEEQGHHCVWVRSGRKALECALSQQCDCIVLDRMLPDRPGLEVEREIRARGVQTPVLVLTALGAVDDRVMGLQAGADDYLVKPFAFAELLARLQAINRRSRKRPSPRLAVGPLSLDLTTRKVTRDGHEIGLTPTEFSMLELLMRHAGQVVTRKMLCQHLWDEDWEGVTNVVEVHMTRLRAKIDRDFSPPLLQTGRGRGYVLRSS